MTIYELVYVMDNMQFPIVIINDNMAGVRGPADDGRIYTGSVEDFKMTDLYDGIQDEEITDLYTIANGTLVICYCREEEDDPTQYGSLDYPATPWGGCCI